VRVSEVRRRLDLGQKPNCSHDCRQLGVQDLQRDLALVLQVIGQVDRGHPACTELALDAVPTFEGRVEAGDGIGVDHGATCGTMLGRAREADLLSTPFTFHERDSLVGDPGETSSLARVYGERGAESP
jgi:hypothetical protein